MGRCDRGLSQLLSDKKFLDIWKPFDPDRWKITAINIKHFAKMNTKSDYIKSVDSIQYLLSTYV